MTYRYRKDQIVMGCPASHARPDEWFIGVVTHGTNPEYGWTGAEVRSDPSGTSVKMPGWQQQDLRLATDEDIAALPDWQREWLEGQQERIAQAALDLTDPRVPWSTKAVRMALHEAGIRRLSDLQRFSDTDLKALKGMGAKSVAALRVWQEAAEADVAHAAA